MSPTVLAPEDYARIVFFTGAGLSAECGLRTYRGRGGLWASYHYEDYACQSAFDRDPDKVWDFHDERRRVMGAATPGLAHRIIARIQRRLPTTAIVTQNIDGLHQRAGARNVTELHGSVWRIRCRCAGSPRRDRLVPVAERRCTTCGAWRRPDIVWFGDALDEATVRMAAQALRCCDLLVSIGTSAVVYPAAELPRLARQAGALCVEVNPEETPASGLYDLRLRERASACLARLWPDLARAVEA